jgi:16S rRNA (cytidine1402-2'-O)-methyltransferase
MAQPGTLYLIPAPLGEQGDISSVIPERVRRIAAVLDTFVVEHPKTARQVLKRLGTQIPLQQIQLVVLDKDTPPEQLARLLQPLLAGKNVGLMSEAGCPAVADPGALLVRLAHDKGIPVAPLVGPSSILLALMASGLNGQRFAFHGYLPVDKTERRKKLAELEQESRTRDQTQIFIETPYRNRQLAEDILAACARNTSVCIAADLTQPGEFVKTRKVGEWGKNLPDLNKRPAIFLLYAA